MPVLDEQQLETLHSKAVTTAEDAVVVDDQTLVYFEDPAWIPLTFSLTSLTKVEELLPEGTGQSCIVFG
jgi:hypothetical protein